MKGEPTPVDTVTEQDNLFHHHTQSQNLELDPFIILLPCLPYTFASVNLSERSCSLSLSLAFQSLLQFTVGIQECLEKENTNKRWPSHFGARHSQTSNSAGSGMTLSRAALRSNLRCLCEVLKNNMNLNSEPGGLLLGRLNAPCPNVHLLP
jgi:hypothetical protein